MKQFQQACVGAFIVNDKREVLVVKRSLDDDFLPGMWELPGGGVEFGESPQDAVVREVKEEVGLDVEVVKPVSVDWYLMEKEDEKIQRVEVTFLCKTLGDPLVTLSHEHSEYKWVSQEDLKELGLTKFMKKTILTSFENV